MPAHTTPKSGMRNQKKESCDPSKRSLMAKSVCVVVPLVRPAEDQLGALRKTASLPVAKNIERQVSAMKRTGREDRMHWFMLSEKLM